MEQNPPPRPANLFTLKEVLAAAERGGYALGAFSPRYTPMIRPVLAAGEAQRSPLIVQISQRELQRYGITPDEFAAEFHAQMAQQQITIPVVLHLDHTKEFSLIQQAIAAGFTSVMIDASDKPLQDNIAISRAVTASSHASSSRINAARFANPVSVSWLAACWSCSFASWSCSLYSCVRADR